MKMNAVLCKIHNKFIFEYYIMLNSAFNKICNYSPRLNFKLLIHYCLLILTLNNINTIKKHAILIILIIINPKSNLINMSTINKKLLWN